MTLRGRASEVYGSLYEAIQTLAEATHADMEERQQRQLQEYQAKVNEIRACCTRAGPRSPYRLLAYPAAPTHTACVCT
jgi:hypothetical protein